MPAEDVRLRLSRAMPIERMPCNGLIWRMHIETVHASALLPTRTRLDAAIHEASHAVMLMFHGYTPQSAYIDADGGGILRPEPSGAPVDFSQCHASVLRLAAAQITGYLLTGLQGELLLHAIDPRDRLMLADKSDFYKASILLDGLGMLNDGMLLYSQQLARSVLSVEWVAVARIGEELYRRGSLKGGEMRALYGA